MNLVELYKQTPEDRHSEIIVSSDRLFFDGAEYVLQPDGELRLVRSEKELKQKLIAIEAKLGTIKPSLIS